MLGGLSKRTLARQWDGQIEALRVAGGYLADEALSPDTRKWGEVIMRWRATDPPDPRITWSGSDTPDQNDPAGQAMNDLCLALLNSNEFFYLH